MSEKLENGHVDLDGFQSGGRDSRLQGRRDHHGDCASDEGQGILVESFGSVAELDVLAQVDGQWTILECQGHERHIHEMSRFLPLWVDEWDPVGKVDDCWEMDVHGIQLRFDSSVSRQLVLVDDADDEGMAREEQADELRNIHATG